MGLDTTLCVKYKKLGENIKKYIEVSTQGYTALFNLLLKLACSTAPFGVFCNPVGFCLDVSWKVTLWTVVAFVGTLTRTAAIMRELLKGSTSKSVQLWENITGSVFLALCILIAVGKLSF